VRASAIAMVNAACLATMYVGSVGFAAMVAEVTTTSLCAARSKPIFQPFALTQALASASALSAAVARPEMPKAQTMIPNSQRVRMYFGTNLSPWRLQSAHRTIAVFLIHAVDGYSADDLQESCEAITPA
jgi:hypothetical protein